MELVIALVCGTTIRSDALRGLWAGLTSGLFLSSTAEWAYAMVWIDWEKESVKAQLRAAEERRGAGSVYAAPTE